MKKNILLVLSLATLLFPLSSQASDTRVSSTGGLSLVMTDEAFAPVPFLMGNPAGLAFLPRQSRFDLAASFFDQDDLALGRNTKTYGSGELGVARPKFHGLLLFPADRLALQLDADFRHVGEEYQIGLVSDGFDRIQGLLRVAYDFGPFVLGVEAMPSQIPITFVFQPFSSGNAYGSANISQWDLTGGLLARFPPDPTDKEARLTIGGAYATQPLPFEAKLDLSLVDSGGPTTQTLSVMQTGTSYHSFGPEVYYEVPGSFQAGLAGRMTTTAASRETASSAASLVTPEFPYETLTHWGGMAVFKAENPLSKTQSLKMGAALIFETSRVTHFDPAGALTDESRGSKWKAQAGAGVEKKGDFLVGGQLELELAGGDLETPVTVTQGAAEFMGYKVILGGEKWLSKTWAFRTGLSFENDLNTGTQPYKLPLGSVAPGTRRVNTTITLGAGLRDGPFLGDFLLWYGQPSLYDSPLPGDFTTQLGIQFAATFLFK